MKNALVQYISDIPFLHVIFPITLGNKYFSPKRGNHLMVIRQIDF